VANIDNFTLHMLLKLNILNLFFPALSILKIEEKKDLKLFFKLFSF